MKRLIGPFLLSLFMFVVLMSLGFWQVARLHWKEGLLADIAAATANPPIPLGASPRAFTKVFVTGRWDPAHAALYGTDVRNDKLGAFMIEPLLRADGPPILVDRGFVPDGAGKLQDPIGSVTVVGYIREPEYLHWWGIKDDLAERHFYTLNPQVIAAELGFPAPQSYTLVAMGNATTYPEPAHAFPDLPNNHLSYTITWFSLALVNVVIFLLSSRKRLLERSV